MSAGHGEHEIAGGFRFPEGPSFGPDGNLYVVELAGSRISRVDVAAGTREGFISTPGSPNGSAFGPDGTLFVCNGGGRWAPERSTGGKPGTGGHPSLLQQVAPDGNITTLISDIDGIPLNSPNDICFDDRGGFYFTDPAWPDSTGQIPPGTICYATPDGNARRVHTGMSYPNGLGVTGDGSHLVVAESGTRKLIEFEIRSPGILGDHRDIAYLGADAIPDGLCFDVEDRILCAAHGAGAIFVIPPGGGEPEERIELEDPDPTNLCFGGDDGTTLYITEADSGRVVSVEWRAQGMPLFPGRSW